MRSDTMPTLAEKSRAEYLCRVLNEHIRIEHVDGTEDGVTELEGEFKSNDGVVPSDFLLEMMSVIDRLCPAGTTAYVGESGFALGDEPQVEQ
jgi:hypothetical protein